MMKNLDHYFTESVKSDGIVNNNNNESNNRKLSLNIIKKSNNNNNKSTAAINKNDNDNNDNKKKRSRVKIKISQDKNNVPTCNIIESKHDLIDKTPSPFTTSSTKVSSTKVLPDETPKKSTLKNFIKSNNDNVDNIDDDDESIKINIKSKNTKKNSNSNNDKPIKHEESNAFKIMMTTRAKHNEQNQSTETTKSIVENKINNIKQSNKKENKKNIKRKIIIEDDSDDDDDDDDDEEEFYNVFDVKKSENNGRVIKKAKKDEDIKSPIKTQVQNQKTSIGGGNLHNYFSKLTPEEKEKERLAALSTVVVKAEIHEPAGSIISSSNKIFDKSKTSFKSLKSLKSIKSKTRKVLATIDDIQVLRSETPSPPPSPSPSPAQVPSAPSSPLAKQNKKSIIINKKEEQRQKPKWTLRINLSSSNHDADDDLDLNKNNNDIVEDDDEQFVDPKSKNKSINKRKKNNNVKSSENKFIDKNFNKESMIVDKLIKENYKDEEKKKLNNEKLAPLFLKKAKPDPEIAAARRRFLTSWPSDNNSNKKQIKKTESFNNGNLTYLPFPKISHIYQHNNNNNNKFNDDDDNNKIIKFKSSQYIPNINNINVSNFKSLINYETCKNKTSNLLSSTKKIDTEEILKDIETRCDDARNIWKFINEKTTTKKLESQDNNNNNNNNSLMWIYKYRPLNALQIIGNEEAGLKLKNWLNEWKVPVRINSKYNDDDDDDDYSSGDDFYSSDNSNQGNNNKYNKNNESNQAAILLGPHGCGKTASVYAVAEELGYKILEVNASSKRQGKKILKDFEEATQSHRIKKNNNFNTLNKNLIENNNNNNNEKIPQNSLILVEDVDLIFDEDEGFISAINQLTLNTKRPIVMTCTDTCFHLSKIIASQQMKIYLKPSNNKKLSSFIELIALAETGKQLTQINIDRLLADCDIRKALLQLQYLLSNGININDNDDNFIIGDFNNTFYQDVKYYIYRSAIKMYEKKLNLKQKNNYNIINNLSNSLNAISLISSLIDINDKTLDNNNNNNIIKLKFEPSLSLLENNNLYSNNHVQSYEIASWIRNNIFFKYSTKQLNEQYKINNNNNNNNNMLYIKNQFINSINLLLSNVTTFNIDTKSINIDYLPTVRTICRAEDKKQLNNVKRGKRFFHYLSNLRLPGSTLKPNILSAASKIMFDKDETTN